VFKKYSLYEGNSFILTFFKVYVYTNKYLDYYINHGIDRTHKYESNLKIDQIRSI